MAARPLVRACPCSLKKTKKKKIGTRTNEKEMDEDKGERREKDQESRNQKRNQIVSKDQKRKGIRKGIRLCLRWTAEKRRKGIRLWTANRCRFAETGNKAKKRHKRDRAGPRGCGRQKVSDTQR